MRDPGRDLGRNPSGALVLVGGSRGPALEPGCDVPVRRAQSGPRARISIWSLGQNLRAGPLARARNRARVGISDRNLGLGTAFPRRKSGAVSRFPHSQDSSTSIILKQYSSDLVLCKNSSRKCFYPSLCMVEIGKNCRKTTERPDAHGCGALRLREEGPSVKPRNGNGTETTSPSWS